MPELNTQGALIKTTYEAETDTNAFTDTEKTKLAGVATSAIAASGVTFEALTANGDVGTGATQVAAGNHAHAGVYQPADAQLDTWAGVTPSANGQSLVAAASYAAMRGLLDLEAGTDFYSISAVDAALALRLPLAGGTLLGALTLGTGASIAGGDKVASALELKDVGETAPAAGSITGSITRSFADGAVQELTLTGNVVALSISNPPASGIAGTITFIINHGTGPFTWAHPSGIKWPGAVAPTMSSGTNDISIVSYMTRDGGATWYGFFGGADFS